MNIAKPVAFAVLVTLSATPMAAKVYKSQDADGNVVYTDDPGGDARPVDLPPLSTYPAPDVEPLETSDSSEDQPQSAGVYRNLAIASPTPESTVRDNTGNVVALAVVAPELQEAAGHRFQFYLDGKALVAPTNRPQATFNNVNRGAHEVSVAVVDAAGNILKRSPNVTFYLHRQSQNFPYGPKPGKP